MAFEPETNLDHKKLVGIIGSGDIGRDPFDPRSWSGISRFLFTELQKVGRLRRAFGVEASRLYRVSRMLRHFRPSRRVWRDHFYMDVPYRDALTEQIRLNIAKDSLEDDFLQIGGMYNVPQLLDGRARCFSYHDGNIIQSISGPYAPKSFCHRTVDRAIHYEREVYHGMTKVLVMSEYLRQSFINDFGLPEDRVTVIGAGINLQSVPSYVPDKRYDTQEILFIGVDFARKGGWKLLQAFKAVRDRLPRAVLNIVGPPKLKISQELLGGVNLFGYLRKEIAVENEKMQSLFRNCCLFVLPSLYEPFGIAPLEAMVHQIPCVVTDGWALRENVVKGVTGELVEAGNVDDLAEKMFAALRDANNLRRMGEAARQRVLKFHTWEIVVRQLLTALAPSSMYPLPIRSE